MLIVVSYDIEDDRKRTRLAKSLKDFGPRVQRSVFEADINEQELSKLCVLLQIIKLESSESIRVYRICRDCSGKIMIFGSGEVTKDKPYYIV